MSMERQILVVDDEAVIRLHIRDILTAAGYSVIEGGDGVEGLDAFIQHNGACCQEHRPFPTFQTSGAPSAHFLKYSALGLPDVNG